MGGRALLSEPKSCKIETFIRRVKSSTKLTRLMGLTHQETSLRTVPARNLQSQKEEGHKANAAEVARPQKAETVTKALLPSQMLAQHFKILKPPYYKQSQQKYFSNQRKCAHVWPPKESSNRNWALKTIKSFSYGRICPTQIVNTGLDLGLEMWS